MGCNGVGTRPINANLNPLSRFLCALLGHGLNSCISRFNNWRVFHMDDKLCITHLAEKELKKKSDGESTAHTLTSVGRHELMFNMGHLASPKSPKSPTLTHSINCSIRRSYKKNSFILWYHHLNMRGQGLMGYPHAEDESHVQATLLSLPPGRTTTQTNSYFVVLYPLSINQTLRHRL